MVFTLLSLIQAQPQKTPLVVWIVLILLFLGGISMIVYFFRRLKKVEKEPEEDWSLSRNTLFVTAPPVVKEAAVETQSAAEEKPRDSAERVERIEAAEETPAESPYEMPPFVPQTETRELASEDFTGPSLTAPEEVTPLIPAESRPAEALEQPPSPVLPAPPAHYVQETQALGSAPDEAVEPPRQREAAIFDDEVWAELEPSDSAASALRDRRDEIAGGTAGEVRAPVESEPSYRAESVEPGAFARVDRAAPRAPFEPPRIEPLSPRGNEPAPRISKPASAPAPFDAPREIEASVPPAASARRERKAAGSVLGIPAEAGVGPLILGTPRKESQELGIGGLTNYGKDTNEGGGHGGTIALVLAILLVAGALLSYFKIPSVHSRVDEVVARVRKRNPAQQAAPAASEPKARIFPARTPEVVKNMVKARGAVDNISQQELSNLYVEVSLERYDGGPPDTRNLQVTPATLAPAQRGIYELPYDGKQYRGYGITKLTSNGEEVRFIAPKQ
jgi:hypothetical protein